MVSLWKMMAFPRLNLNIERDERLPAALLVFFFVALCVAGGASKEDVLAQALIRGCAVIAMLVQVVAGRLPDVKRYKACFWVLGSMTVVALVQLIPLPFAMWSALPAREIIVSIPSGYQGWRPISLVPDAGWNALFSLLVPLCVLVLFSSLRERTTQPVRYAFIGAAVISAILALLRAAGTVPENPLINGSSSDYGGIFANRNHQALFLAVGIALVAPWMFQPGQAWRNRRVWLALCITLLLGISILATGSRSGALLGAVAVVVAPMLARRVGARGEQGRAMRATLLWLAMSVLLVGGIALVSLYFGRAQSLDRATDLAADGDFRLRALPVTLAVAKTYFPFGSGLGTFDTVFRIAEPYRLLEPTYFNHAHNDLLETVIETGILGPIIFIAAIVWLFRRLVALYKRGEGGQTAKMGALVIGLVIAASVSDYPARTPMIMALLMVAGCWLSSSSQSAERRESRALPLTR